MPGNIKPEGSTSLPLPGGIFRLRWRCARPFPFASLCMSGSGTLSGLSLPITSPAYRCGRSSRPSHTPLAIPQPASPPLRRGLRLVAVAGVLAAPHPACHSPTRQPHGRSPHLPSTACQTIRTPPVYPCLTPEPCKTTAN